MALVALYCVAAIAAMAALTACTFDSRNAASTRSTVYEARITRTEFGIPHIRARDFAGLGFGAAYARAQDNVCLMADAYVSTAGERSRFFGASGTTVIGLVSAQNIDSDIFYRTVPDLEGLHSDFAGRSSDYQALVDGWVSGYNRFLRDHQDRLPLPCAGQSWVREITRDDVLQSINGFSMLSSSSVLATPIANAVPPGNVAAQDDRVRTAASADADASAASLGSNGWAFGGDATQNHKGLVVANPHFPWVGPNRFYEMQLTIDGTLDVAGASIMNLPFIGIGFNHDVAWTHTVDMAAHMTLYKLELDPADPTAYLVDGQREPMSHREIYIPDKDGSPVVRTVYATRYGPVVSIPGTEYAWTRQTAYAVADADNGNLRSGEAWLAMARAHTVEDIRSALARHLGIPFLNTMAADRAGTALYADITPVPHLSDERFASCGRIAKRLPGHLQELFVVDGSRSACAWETSPDTAAPGLLPAARMATLYRRDFVQNSNDSYRWSNPAEPLHLDAIMGRDPGLGGLRTRAAIQEIGRVLTSGRFDIDLAAQTMLGNKELAADLTLPSLKGLCARPNAPGDACAALARWDGRADITSKGAALFNLFWAKVGTRPDLWKVAFDPEDPVHTPRDLVVEGNTGDALLAALSDAAKTLKDLGFAANVALGEVQFAERGDQRIPVSGAQYGGVLNYTKTIPVTGGFSVVFGSSYIQSVTFDDRGPVADAILTYSQSTDPSSPHFADQTLSFSTKTLHRFAFSEAEIAAEATGPTLTVRQ